MKRLKTIKKEHKNNYFPFQLMKEVMKGGTENPYICSQEVPGVLWLCKHLSELHVKLSAGIINFLSSVMTT